MKIYFGVALSLPKFLASYALVDGGRAVNISVNDINFFLQIFIICYCDELWNYTSHKNCTI